MPTLVSQGRNAVPTLFPVPASGRGGLGDEISILKEIPLETSKRESRENIHCGSETGSAMVSPLTSNYFLSLRISDPSSGRADGGAHADSCGTSDIIVMSRATIRKNDSIV